MSAVDVALRCDNIHGEGPVWSEREQLLYWTDIEGSRIWRYNPVSDEADSIAMAEKVCAIAFRKRGGLLLALEGGLAFFNPDNGTLERIHDVESEIPGTRLNDGRCDRNGRFVVGGFDNDAAGRSGVYRLDPDLSIHHLFGGLSSGNSTCFSLDGRTMFHADTPQAEIWAFDYNLESGEVGDRRTFCTFADQPGVPDGSVIDADGCLWNAQWNGGRVVRYTPDGSVDRVIEVPVTNPTCITFGGPELDTLYITTSRLTLSEEQRNAEPDAGNLLAVKPGVKGLAEDTFGG